MNEDTTHLPEHVYELVDVTDEEMYHTIGLYYNLRQAVMHAITGDRPPAVIYDHYVGFQIRKRRMGFSGWSETGHVVARIGWNVEYADNGEGGWNVNATIHEQVSLPKPAEHIIIKWDITTIHKS
jgi:hypothetical protein